MGENDEAAKRRTQASAYNPSGEASAVSSHRHAIQHERAISSWRCVTESAARQTWWPRGPPFDPRATFRASTASAQQSPVHSAFSWIAALSAQWPRGMLSCSSEVPSAGRATKQRQKSADVQASRRAAWPRFSQDSYYAARGIATRHCHTERGIATRHAASPRGASRTAM